jgi:RNA polymerase-binding transcription factor DksA
MSTTRPTDHTASSAPDGVLDTLLGERAEHQARLAELPPDDPVVDTVVAALAAVDAALASLEAGTYGSCTDCGGQIPSERLAAVPAATLCVRCLDRPRKLFG